MVWKRIFFDIPETFKIQLKKALLISLFVLQRLSEIFSLGDDQSKWRSSYYRELKRIYEITLCMKLQQKHVVIDSFRVFYRNYTHSGLCFGTTLQTKARSDKPNQTKHWGTFSDDCGLYYADKTTYNSTQHHQL